MNEFNLVKLDSNGLSQLGEALVNKVSDAIGGIAKPRQMKKLAEATAKAAIILTTADIECDELRRRAAERWMTEETRKQANIESITTKAIPLLEKTSKPESIENDWLVNFFENCRNISDDDVQSIWARILASQASGQAKFSRKTINLLNDFDKQDCIFFIKLCGFVINLGEGTCPLITLHTDPYYTDHGITFDALRHLQDLGLILFEPLVGFLEESDEPLIVRYYDESIKLNIEPSPKFNAYVGQVLFTNAGKELYQICDHNEVEGFFEFIKNYYIEIGYLPSIVDPDGNNQCTSSSS